MKSIFRLLSLLALLLFAVPTMARESPESADSAYLAKNYTEAARQYAVLADSIENADLYYNLGNAEYRLKRYPQAVLAYQRALRVDPGHADARYNLALVRTRLADRFTKPSEMFFISWLRDWVTTRSVQHWVALSFVWLVLVFVALAFYFGASRLWVRKVGFFAALISGVIFLVVSVFAFVQRYRYHHNADAVILTPDVQLYASPTKSSKKLLLLHEGTTVTILDTHTKGWLEVALPDGTTAFMADSGYERVITN